MPRGEVASALASHDEGGWFESCYRARGPPSPLPSPSTVKMGYLLFYATEEGRMTRQDADRVLF